MTGTQDDPGHLEGISGWLVFPAIGTFLCPIICAYEIYLGVGAWVAASGMVQFFWLFYVAVALISGAAWIWAIRLLVKKRRLYPLVFSVLSGIAILKLLIIDMFVYYLGAEQERGMAFWNLVRGVLPVIIWVSYMARSRRVKRTFVN